MIPKVMQGKAIDKFYDYDLDLCSYRYNNITLCLLRVIDSRKSSVKRLKLYNLF